MKNCRIKGKIDETTNKHSYVQCLFGLSYFLVLSFMGARLVGFIGFHIQKEDSYMRVSVCNCTRIISRM